MKLTKGILATFAVVGGLTAGTMGLGATVANADPVAPAMQGEVPPAWAPRKPTEVWEGQPVVWTSQWSGRWGVWLNGYFLPLT